MVWFRGGVKLEFVQNSYDLIKKNCDLIDSKGQKIFEKFNEFWFEFDLFDSTPNIGWSQILRKWIHSKLDLKIYNSIDLKGEKIFEKFEKKSIQNSLDSTPPLIGSTFTNPLKNNVCKNCEMESIKG